MSNNKKRTRTWWFVAYPDSLPENWLDSLLDEGIYGFVSPLHDSDIDGDGEVKKPHYHVLLRFSGVKSYDQVKEIADRYNARSPQYINDWRGSCRYLCHLDSPHKAQYSASDVVKLGAGDDYISVIGYSSEKYELIGQMMDFVRQNDVRSFAQLFDYCRAENESWFRCLCDSSSYVMREYIKEYRQEVN